MNKETFEETHSVASQDLKPESPNNANHRTANFYYALGKMEILKQKNTRVDIPNTRKLDGLQQALHTQLPLGPTNNAPTICTF